MRTLVCVRHVNFDETVKLIETEGGKAGYGKRTSGSVNFIPPFLISYTDWVHDKILSKFAFEGMCWERSFIPLPIFQMGDSTSNIIESLHSDVNSEGIQCSLVAGVHKGNHFDNLKVKTLTASCLLVYCLYTCADQQVK